MPRFCVNKNTDNKGDHEVHNLDASCNYLPLPSNRLDLGIHSSCRTAVAQAKQTYSTANGCYWCARQCHTS